MIDIDIKEEDIAKITEDVKQFMETVVQPKYHVELWSTVVRDWKTD